MLLASAAEHAEHVYRAPFHYKLPIMGSTIHLDTIIGTIFVGIALIIMSSIATKDLNQKPSKKQTFFEGLIGFIQYIVSSQIPKDNKKYVPYIGTIFLFVLFSNWMGLIPWKFTEFFTHEFELASPTNDLNTTLGLGIITLCAYLYYGIKTKGIGYFKHYLDAPTPLLIPLMTPLHMMEDITRPLSLAFRLFGNIIGGEIVIGILIFLTAPTLIFTAVALPMYCLEIFVGVIQAFIFAILTASYIGTAIAEHH